MPLDPNIERTAKIESDLVRRFVQTEAAQRAWAKEARTNRQLYHNIAYTPEQITAILSDGMPVTAAPILNAKVQQHTGLIAGEEPSYVASAVEDSDVTLANLATDIVTFEWQQSNGSQHLIQIDRDDFITGRGVFFVYIDPDGNLGEGDVCVHRLEPLEVYPDPRSRLPDWEDADFIIVSHLMTKTKAKKRWGEKVVNDLFARQRKPQAEVADMYKPSGRGYAIDNQILHGDIDGFFYDPDETQYRMIEEYRKIMVNRHVLIEQTFEPSVRKPKKLYTEAEYRVYRQEEVFQIVLPDGNIRFALQPNDVAYWTGQYVAALPNPNDPNSRIIPSVREDQLGIEFYIISQVTKGTLIDQGIIEHRKVRVPRIHVITLFGNVFLHEYDLPTSKYPICPVMSQHDGTPFPTAKSTLIRSLIYQFNKKQQTEIQWGAAVAGPKIYAEEDVILNPDAITSIGPEIIKLRRGTQAEGRIPFRLPMEELPAHYFIEKRELLELIDLVSGLHPQLTQGAPGPSREPYRSFQERDNAQQRRIKIDDRFLALGLTKLAKVTLDLFVSITKRERVLRIFQPSSPASEPYRSVMVNRAIYDDYGNVIDILYDTDALDVDIRFKEGSTFPINRDIEREKYMQYLQIIGPSFLSEFLKKIDIPNWEKIVAENDLITQLQQQLQQLQEENKRLSSQSQSLENQITQTRIQGKVDKAGAQLEKEKGRVQTAGELTRARIQDFQKQQTTEQQQVDMQSVLDKIFSNEPIAGEA